MDYFKRHKFDWSKFRLGMRTFKTGIAVLLYYLFWNIWLARPSDRDVDSCF